jgi:hypothetical protein
LSRSLNVTSGLLSQALDVTLCLALFYSFLNGAKFLLVILDENVQLVNILVEMFLFAKVLLGIPSHSLEKLEITLGLSELLVTIDRLILDFFPNFIGVGAVVRVRYLVLIDQTISKGWLLRLLPTVAFLEEVRLQSA